MLSTRHTRNCKRLVFGYIPDKIDYDGFENIRHYGSGVLHEKGTFNSPFFVGGFCRKYIDIAGKK